MTPARAAVRFAVRPKNLTFDKNIVVMIRRIAFLAALLLACACTGRPALPTAEISDGKVRGRLTPSGDIAVFRGIPYAAPPVGDLRWRPPQPVEPWEGVFEADGFSDIAWQPGHEEGAFYQREFYFGDYPRMNEDCLYLNCLLYTSPSPRDA